MSAKKKAKRECYFNDNWLKNEKFKDFLSKIDDKTATCRLCNVSFTVKYDGIDSIESHSKSNKRKNWIVSKKVTEPINNFFVKKSTCEQNKVIASQITIIYHNIRHNLSYNSLDCNLKLIAKIFQDSKVAKKISCGRTKSEMILVNVLYPVSVQSKLSELGNKFSISIDASNKANVKYFPLCVRYFDKKEGIQNFILDFYCDPNEGSKSIFNRIKTIINENGLSLDNIVSYSADNAPVNFGSNNSVFQKLKLINENIIKANCNCHVLHNTAKFGLKN